MTFHLTTLTSVTPCVLIWHEADVLSQWPFHLNGFGCAEKGLLYLFQLMVMQVEPIIDEICDAPTDSL